MNFSARWIGRTAVSIAERESQAELAVVGGSIDREVTERERICSRVGARICVDGTVVDVHAVTDAAGLRPINSAFVA